MGGIEITMAGRSYKGLKNTFRIWWMDNVNMFREPVVEESLAKLSPTVTEKTERVFNVLVVIAKEISR